MELKEAVGRALRDVRKKRGLTQEQLGGSRVYVSDIERGVKSISVEKLDVFADHLELHGLTLLAMSYLRRNTQVSQKELLKRVENELELMTLEDGDN